MKLDYFIVFLVLVIGLGIFVRLYALEAHYLNGDEEFYIVAAEKFHVGSDYDVRLWNYHAPPVAKYIMGLSLIFTDIDYSIPYAIPPNLFVWNYLAYESIGKVYSLIRMVSALFGILFIIFIFLIGKELFGIMAGLLSAASASIAIDYIILSRTALIDIYLYAFVAATLFFYIKYKNSTNKIPHLVGIFISLILALGTKNLQSLIIIPPILYVEIIGNKKNVLKTINFLFLIGLAFFIHNSFVYPAQFSEPAREFFTTGQAQNIFYLNTIPTFFISLFTINSYFFLLSFILIAVYYIKRVHKQQIKNHIINPTPYSMIIILALLSLFVFSLTTLNQNSKYITQLAIPFFLLGGFIIQGFWSKKIIKGAAVALLLIGLASVVLYFPSYEDYPGQRVISFSSEGRVFQPQLDFLKSMGNPKVVTNNMNLLIFYDGTAVPIPVKNSPSCNTAFLEELRAGGYLGVFRNIGTDEKQFLCDFVFEYKEVLGNFSGSNKIVSF